MTTIIGISDSPASTTAGKKLAAAVPLVHNSSAGTPPSPRPSATNAGDTLVVHDVGAHLGTIGDRQRHRRRSGTRRDDGVRDAEPDPLVDERRAERRLHVLRQGVRVADHGDQTIRAYRGDRGDQRPAPDRPPASPPGPPLARPVVTVDIYSDVVCPWCYIGKRKFEAGLDLVAGEDLGVDFDVTYRPYQLDPTAAPGAPSR